MRIHHPSSNRQASDQYAAAFRFRNVETFVVGTTIGHVSSSEPFAGADPIQRLTQAVENPDGAETGVSDGEVVLLVHRKPVGSAQASRQLDEDSDLRCGS